MGAVGVLAFDRLRTPLKDWILADPGESAQRVALAMSFIAVVLVVALFLFATYLWSIGNRTLRAQEFPPPGLPVSRDTRVMVGEKAMSRARQRKLVAICCGISAAAVAVLRVSFRRSNPANCLAAHGRLPSSRRVAQAAVRH